MNNGLRNVVVFGAAVAGLGWNVEAGAGHVCPGGLPASAADICPVFVSGDPSCSEAAQICSLTKIGEEVRSPISNPDDPSNPPFSAQVTSATLGGVAAARIQDTSPASQQFGTKGYEIAIARRNGAYVYCGTSVLRDVVRAPGNGTPTQVSVCWAQGPCQVSQTDLNNDVCPAYGGSADFVQGFKTGTTEQEPNVCGCNGFLAQFCDERGVINENNDPDFPRFVSCLSGLQPFKALDSQSYATGGTGTCTYTTINGKRMRVCN